MRYKLRKDTTVAITCALAMTTILWVQAYTRLGISLQDQLDKQQELSETIADLRADVDKRDILLSQLFGKKPAEDWLSMDATITWYSLSVEECDNDPDTAAHGKSRPFMAAISMRIVHALNLTPGDRIAVLSDDGKVAAVVVYWDQKNARYDDGNWIDIVAPSQKVAERWAIRPGRIVKL